MSVETKKKFTQGLLIGALLAANILYLALSPLFPS
jgi:hypothetical protein